MSLRGSKTHIIFNRSILSFCYGYCQVLEIFTNALFHFVRYLYRLGVVLTVLIWSAIKWHSVHERYQQHRLSNKSGILRGFDSAFLSLLCIMGRLVSIFDCEKKFKWFLLYWSINLARDINTTITSYLVVCAPTLTCKSLCFFYNCIILASDISNKWLLRLAPNPKWKLGKMKSTLIFKARVLNLNDCVRYHWRLVKCIPVANCNVLILLLQICTLPSQWSVSHSRPLCRNPW